MPRTKGSMGGIKSRTKGGVRYYYTYQGCKQVSLGTDPEKAKERYREHMRSVGEAPKANIPKITPANRVSIAYLFTEFDLDNQARLKARSAEWYFVELQRFLKWLGQPDLAAEDVTPHHLTKFIHAFGLKERKARKIKLSLKRCYRWGAEQKLIKENPFQFLKVPQPGVSDLHYSEAQIKSIIGASDKTFRDVLAFAYLTGWRFDEIRRLEARHVDLKLGVVTFPKTEHKTGEKTGKDLIKILPPEGLAIAKRLAPREGFVFKTERGVPFTFDSEKQRFKTISTKVGFKVLGSAFRKSFCTSAILRGVDLESLKVLMGHESLQMISRHYSKVSQNLEHMKAAAAKAAGPSLLSLEKKPPRRRHKSLV
ncbi:tyrosine-type recombinase/integrase [bacterium]|nr:tyrosine-type recombinase/integrase [bacterium]